MPRRRGRARSPTPAPTTSCGRRCGELPAQAADRARAAVRRRRRLRRDLGGDGHQRGGRAAQRPRRTQATANGVPAMTDTMHSSAAAGRCAARRGRSRHPTSTRRRPPPGCSTSPTRRSTRRVGRLLLAATPRGLVRLAYLDVRGRGRGARASSPARVSPRVLAAPRALDEPRRELEEYFAGARQRVRAPARLAADAGLRPPRAAGDRADPVRLGLELQAGRRARPAARAARAPPATRSAHNPLPIVVPCHRVLHAGGGLGGLHGRARPQARAAGDRGHQRTVVNCASAGRSETTFSRSDHNLAVVRVG